MISKEIKFLLLHSSIYGLGNIVSQLVSFLLLPLYTRYLSPADYGILETIDISNSIIGVVVTVGIGTAMSRFYYVSENIDERNKVVSTTYLTYYFCSLVIFPVLLLSSPLLSKLLFDKTDYSYYFKISFVSLILGGMIDIGLMYMRLIKKPLIFITITLSRLVLLIAFNILFVVYFKMGVLGILYSSMIVRIFYAVVVSIAVLWKIRLGFSLKLSIEMLRYSYPIIPSRIANLAVKQSDKYFVLFFSSLSNMGIYTLSLKIGNAVHNLLTVPFTMAYVPRRFEIMNREDAKETYAKIFSYYIFAMVYIGLCISMLIPEILRVMVSPNFYEAGKIVPLVVVSMIIYGCHNHFEFGLLFSKQTKYVAFINVFSSAMSILCNYFLIQWYQTIGAVSSSIIVMSIQAFLLHHFSNKLYPIRFQFRRIFLFIFLALTYYIVFGYLNLIPSKLFNMFIRVLALILFPFVVFLFRIISPYEAGQLKKVLISRFRAPMLQTHVEKK